MTGKQRKYQQDFGFANNDESEKARLALEHALDIRKFEISLYWQRAAYFWALIAGAFAAYAAILSSENIAEKQYIAYVVACVGIIFTWAWFLANRGSKYWQENWENHVDMLEDRTIGPLYKTILSRPGHDSIWENLVTGPKPMSPSKLNQWVAVFTLSIWLVLGTHVLPSFVWLGAVSIKHLVVTSITATIGGLMFCQGRTHLGSYVHSIRKRRVRIK